MEKRQPAFVSGAPTVTTASMPAAMPGQAPPPSTSADQPVQQRRYEGLDAYRGIAALLLVVFHTYLYSREATAAQTYVYEGTLPDVILRSLRLSAIFFLLAGFLIFLPFARAAVEQRRQRSVRAFLVTRAISILPAYYIAIVIVWTWRYSGANEQLVDLVQHLTFTHIFDRRHIFWTIGPAWTLAIEVMFYILLAVLGPVSFRACSRLSSVRARLALLSGVVLTLGAASVLFKWWAFYIAQIPEDNYPVYFGPMAKLDVFAIGMVLALVVVARRDRPLLRGPLPTLVRVLGFGLLVVLVAVRDQSQLVSLYFHTLLAAAFLLVLASTVLGPSGSLWERIVTWQPLQFLGMISYSIYLWHEPIMVELGRREILTSTSPEAFPKNAVLIIVLTLALATASYWVIQRPTALLRHLFTSEGRLVRRYPDPPMSTPQ